MGPFRSMLFAPGNHPRRAEKVFEAGADAAILDLEDAVATSEKVGARAAVVAALARPRACPAYVRVNGLRTPYCYGDMVAVVRPGLDGIVLPMVEGAEDLRTADWLLTALEREQGLAPGTIDLMPIVETAKGVRALDAIAASGTRVRRLAFGAGDFTLDVGMLWSLDEAELAGVRQAFVLASRAAGLEPPIDTVWTRLDESERLLQSAATALRLGFQGKLCIHPGQVGPVNGLFTPTEEETARARRVVEAFEAAEREGLAAIQVEGAFVDYPIVEKARRTLMLAARIRGAA